MHLWLHLIETTNVVCVSDADYVPRYGNGRAERQHGQCGGTGDVAPGQNNTTEGTYAAVPHVTVLLCLSRQWQSCCGRSAAAVPTTASPYHNCPCSSRPDAAAPAMTGLMWMSNHYHCGAHSAATAWQTQSLVEGVTGRRPGI